ncbi:MAG: hypothetical protein Tsb0020_24880 [Haliangiales bacterium]
MQRARRRPRRSLAALAALAALAIAHPPADAQSKRYPPPPVDVDDPGPLHSHFWQRVLHPDSDRYSALLVKARELLNMGITPALEEASEHLEAAIALRPEGVEAHWLHAMALETLQRWPACASAYSAVFALDARYQPSFILPSLSPRKAAWALDFGLAMCRARVGDYEDAVTHFTRIASRGVTRDASVSLHLGEAYMALGRLEEAIEVMDAAARQAPSDARVAYALAVAHDRNELLAEAEAYLDRARKLNVSLSLLEDASAVFIPEADRSYTLSLALAHRQQPATALFMMRRYLAEVGDSPWRYRAEQHLDQLAPSAQPAATATTKSATPIAPEDVRSAIGRIDAELQACVRQTPLALFALTVRIVAGRAQPAGARLGVKTQVIDSFATPIETLTAAQQCIEGVAERLPLRTPARARGVIIIDLRLIAR